MTIDHEHQSEQASNEGFGAEKKMYVEAMAMLFSTAEVTAYHQHQLGFKVDLKVIFNTSAYVLVEAVRVLKHLSYPAPTLNAVKHSLRCSAVFGHRFRNLLAKFDQIQEDEKRTSLLENYLERLPEHEAHWRYIVPHLEALCLSYRQDNFEGRSGFQKHTLDRLKRALINQLGKVMSKMTHMQQSNLSEPPAVYFALTLIKFTGCYGGYAAALLKKEPDSFLKRGLKFLDECAKTPPMFTIVDQLLPPGHA